MKQAFVAAIAALTVVATATACSSDSDEKGGLIRAWATPTASTLTLWVAQEQGFFDEVGLDVEVELGSDQATALQALGSRVDIAFTTTPVLFSALNKHFPVKVISGQTSQGSEHPGCGIILSNEPIDDVRELQGKRVGVTSLTSIIPLSAQYVIQARGGDPEAMKLVQVNFP